MKFFRWLLLLSILPAVAGCSTSTFEWKEEVQLLDGRVIVVTQKRRYQRVYDGQSTGDIPRESWLTFSLPETEGKDIVWNEKLEPMVLNMHQGKIYIVGIPSSWIEYNLYGKPRPPYVCFQFATSRWQRIRLDQLPLEIYDANLVLNGRPSKINGLVTTELKKSNAMNGNHAIFKYYKRVDPAYQSNF